MQIRTIDSRVGKLTITTQNNAIIAISDKVLDEDYFKKLFKYDAWEVQGEHTVNIEEQLDEYFKGKRSVFSLTLRLYGTDFQRQVWKACASIPYGQTRSYGELAGMIGNPKAMRAVGSALGSNPIPIIVPCHRVLQSGGKLGGFGWGLEAKLALLDLEKKHWALRSEH